MSSRLVIKLSVSGSEKIASQSSQVKEKEEVEITGRVSIRLFPIISTRLVAKLCFSGRRRRGSERAVGNHWASN
jgi:hypothetical protein